MRLSKTIGWLGLVFWLTAVGATAHGQTWSEWFRQGKTQQKYLLEHLAALKVYTGYLKKGYTIARDGLGLVKEITDGEFKLHELFTSGLKKVSPLLAQDARLGEMIAMELEIARMMEQMMDRQGHSLERAAYLGLVKGEVLKAGLVDVEELLLVLSTGRVDMSDDQRLSRLAKIYQRMQDRWIFTQDFYAKVMQLSQQMDREVQSIKQLGGFYEIIK